MTDGRTLDIVVPDDVAKEKIQLLEALGATVEKGESSSGTMDRSLLTYTNSTTSIDSRQESLRQSRTSTRRRIQRLSTYLYPSP